MQRTNFLTASPYGLAEVNFQSFIIDRRKRSQQESDKVHVQLKDIGSGSPRSTTSTANLVYQDPYEMGAPIKKDNQVYENFKVIAKTKPGEQIYQNTKMDTEGHQVNQFYQNVTDIRNGKGKLF